MNNLLPSTNSTGTLASHSTASDSSRTDDSSKSGSSVKTDGIDRDYTKDNVGSPIDLECKIQAERITKILNETIYKTKLAICLPQLVQEYKTLSTVLSPGHILDLELIFEEYANPLASASLLNVEAMEDINQGNLTLENRLNPELGHLIYIMNSYPALRPKVEEMVDTMKANYVIGTSPPQPNLDYLVALEDFRDLAVDRMQSTAADELLDKIITRKMEASNAHFVDKIAGLTQVMKEESERFEQNMIKKRAIITKLEYEIALFDVESKAKLKKKILDSDRQMVLTSRMHATKYELLKEEEVERKEAYTTLLDRHLQDERSQRLRRCKMETQIQSWLQKYDLDLGEKQTELDDITDQYEDELKQIDELEVKLAEQNIDYIPLMEEREAEYQQEMMEKMNKFRTEHAARVIQHAWRQILLNRAEKKKLIKMLRVQQAAEKAAAKLQLLEQKQQQAEKKSKRTKQKNTVEEEQDNDD